MCALRFGNDSVDLPLRCHQLADTFFFFYIHLLCAAVSMGFRWRGEIEKSSFSDLPET